VPFVIAALVNEWPDPATVTVRPASAAVTTAAASCSRSRGRTISAGRHSWSPAQLRQTVACAEGRRFGSLAIRGG